MNNKPSERNVGSPKAEAYAKIDLDLNNSELQKDITKFHLDTFEILKSPESKLNLIDSLVDYSNALIVNSPCESEKQLLQRNTIKVIHHLVFYVQYKIEYQNAVIQRLNREIIASKLRIVNDTMYAIFELLNSLNSQQRMVNIEQEVKHEILVSLKNFMTSIEGYFNQKEHLKRERNELETIKSSFEEFITVLVKKLYKRRTVLGQSYLICGIIENYQTVIVNQPAEEMQIKYKNKLKKSRLTRSKVRKNTLTTISILSLLYLSVLIVLLTLVGASKLIMEPVVLFGWLVRVWSYKYLLSFVFLSAYVVGSLTDMLINRTLAQREKPVQQKIKDEFRVMITQHYYEINQIYSYFNESSEALFSEVEVDGMIEDKLD